MLTPEDLKDIVAVLDSTALEHFHVETATIAVTLWRDPDGHGWAAETTVTRRPNLVEDLAPAAAGAPASSPPTSPDTPTAATTTATTTATTAATTGAGSAAHLAPVTPPLLGTFYRAPQPGAAPFVDVGSQVEPDTVVGIIETMKMMNPVHAGVRGHVVEICVGDAEFAPVGTVLMLIEPDPPRLLDGAGG